LMGELATYAWETKTPFVNVLLKNNEVTSRLNSNIIKEITDPLKYVGESKNIVTTVFKKYHQIKTL